jgi:hypothetical protein
MTRKSAYQQKQIPQTARTLVAQRETQRCARCASNGSQWHHRRSRRVVQQHRHCPCNGVWLCHVCHRYLHHHPEEARRQGFIVPGYEPEPGVLPVRTWWGWRYHLCDGQIEWVNPVPISETGLEADQMRKERSEA